MTMRILCTATFALAQAFTPVPAMARSRFASRGLAMAAAASPEAVIQEHIASAPVAVFSKSTCPFCARTKSLFEEMGADVKYLELNERDDGPAIQAALATICGQRTVPNTFINGEHLGGNDDAQREAKSGAIQAKLGL